MGFAGRVCLLASGLLALAACGSDPDSPPRPSPTPGAPGRFVYVGAIVSRDVWGFAVDPTTGALRFVGATALDPDTPLSVVADADGRRLWVPSSAGGIRAFAIDRSSGALVENAGSPFDTAKVAQGLAPDSTGRYLFATRFDTRRIEVLAVDAATGALRPDVVSALDLTGPSIAPVAVAPDGRSVYASVVTPSAVDGAVFDPARGSLTRAGPPTSVPDTPSCLSVDPAGSFLYVAAATFLSSDSLFAYSIDVRSGGLTRVSGPALDPAFDAVAANLRPGCVCFLPTGRVAYVADRPARTGAGSRGFWAFPTQASGRLGPASVGPFTTPGLDPVGLAIDPAGRFAYAIDGRGGTVSAFAIDPATSALSPVGDALPAGLFPSAVVAVP